MQSIMWWKHARDSRSWQNSKSPRWLAMLRQLVIGQSISQWHTHQKPASENWRQFSGACVIDLIMANYLPRGSAVTGAYCANEIRQLWEALKTQQRRVKLWSSIYMECICCMTISLTTTHLLTVTAMWRLLWLKPKYGYDLSILFVRSNTVGTPLPTVEKQLRGRQYLNDNDVVYLDFLWTMNTINSFIIVVYTSCRNDEISNL